MKKTLIDITPLKFQRCAIDASCPTVFKSSENTYVIIGKTLSSNANSSLHGRVGSDETAIEISLELLEEAILGALRNKTA